MEPADWIAEAKKHQTALADLIRNYHPRSVIGKHQPFLGGVKLDSKANQNQPTGR